MEAVRKRSENPEGIIKKASFNKGMRKPLGMTNRMLSIHPKDKKMLGSSLKENQISNVKSVRVTRSVSAKKEVKKTLSKLAIKEPLAGKLPDDCQNIDTDDARNPQLLGMYVNDIYNYMRILEASYPIRKNHLVGQPEVTGKMRAVLIDWLIQVHLRFNLLQETLYMTVSIIDRFLQCEKVKRSELQLVGVTAMFIASKFEEMYSPEVGDFVYITDNTYSKTEVLKMERAMLKKLDFNLSRPLPLHFLRRYSKAGNVDLIQHTLSKYLLEASLTEYELAHLSPSLLAAAAAWLSGRLLLLQPDGWSPTLRHYSRYEEDQLLPAARALCALLLKTASSKQQAVHSKYASSKLMKISLIKELKSPVVTELAAAK